MEKLKTYAIVFKLKGGKELKLDTDNDKRQDLIMERMREAVNSPTADVVFIGEYDTVKIMENLPQGGSYSSYALFTSPFSEFTDSAKSALWDRAKSRAESANHINLIDNTYSMQLLSFWTIDD